MMTQNSTKERPPRLRVAFQFLALFLLLVVTPLVSWYYLREGLDYRLEHLNKLEKLGNAPSGTWEAQNGKRIDSELWKGQISLVSFLQKDAGVDQLSPAIRKLHTQFDDRDDVRFYQFISDSLDQNAIISPDEEQWVQILVPEEEFLSLRNTWDIKKEGGLSPKIILVDMKGEIRQAFSIASQKELVSLVEVIAVMLPQKKTNKPTLNRESEK